mgnify:CR=1 FL=1
MKKLLTAMLLGAALFAVSGCTNAAGGGSGNGGTSGEIDYLARLIGTWYTPGYDRDEYISVIDETHTPPLTYKYKTKLTFTRTEFIAEGSYKDSSDEEWVKNGTKTETDKIIAITATYFQIKKDSIKMDYEIQPNGNLRLTKTDFFIFKRK